MTTNNTLTIAGKNGTSIQYTVGTVKTYGIMLIVKCFDHNDKFIFGARHYPQNLGMIEKDFGKDVRDFVEGVLA